MHVRGLLSSTFVVGGLIAAYSSLNAGAASNTLPDYIWSNSKGAIEAGSCKVELRSDVPYRIANDPVAEQAAGFEYLHDSKPCEGSSSQDLCPTRPVPVRSLVKMETSRKKFDGYQYVVIAGIHSAPGMTVPADVAWRNFDGFMKKDDLASIANYVVQITDKSYDPFPESEEVKVGKLPGTKFNLLFSYLQPAIEKGKFVVFKCGRKEYPAFEIFIANEEQSVGRIGVYYDESTIFRNIRVFGGNEVEEVLGDSELSQTPVQVTKPAPVVEVTTPVEVSTPIKIPVTEGPAGDDSTVPRPYIDPGFPLVLTAATTCTNDKEGNVLLRDEFINAISVDDKDIKIANGSDISLVTGGKTIQKNERNYVMIQFGSQLGWISDEYIAAKKENCPSLNRRFICTKDGGPIKFRKGDDMAIDDTIDNMTEVGSLGEEKTWEENVFSLIRFGDEDGYGAKDFLVEDPNTCASKDIAVDENAPGGSFVECMDREMPIIAGSYGCQHNGKCGKQNKPRGQSLKKCAAWLKTGIIRCGGSRSYVECGEAKNCGKPLMAAGFKKLGHKDPRKAPHGAIVVYGNVCKRPSHPAGHIEYKRSETEWISDYIGNKPRNEKTKCRPVLGIYYKP